MFGELPSDTLRKTRRPGWERQISVALWTLLAPFHQSARQHRGDRDNTDLVAEERIRRNHPFLKIEVIGPLHLRQIK